MKIETPVLRRLGPVPFWRGGDKCLPALDAIYRVAAEKSRRVLASAAASGACAGAKKKGKEPRP